MFHLFSQPEQHSVEAFHLASQWRIVLNLTQHNKGIVQTFDTRMVKLKNYAEITPSSSADCRPVSVYLKSHPLSWLLLFLNYWKTVSASLAQIKTWLQWQQAGSGRHCQWQYWDLILPNLWCMPYMCVKEEERRCAVRCAGYKSGSVFVWEKGKEKSQIENQQGKEIKAERQEKIKGKRKN